MPEDDGAGGAGLGAGGGGGDAIVAAAHDGRSATGSRDWRIIPFFSNPLPPKPSFLELRLLFTRLRKSPSPAAGELRVQTGMRASEAEAWTSRPWSGGASSTLA